MQPDEDEFLTLTKWPFYLGDALLVAAALAIAILGDWNLTNFQVAACVTAVALGAGLFVLPYLAEYYMRSREQREDRDSQIRVVRRRLEALEAAFSDGDGDSEAMRRMEAELSSITRASEVLTSAVDQKFSIIEGLHSRLVEQVNAVASRLSESEALLAQKADAAQLAPTRQFEARFERVVQLEQLDAVRVELDALNEQLQVLNSLDARLKTLEAAPRGEAEADAGGGPRPPREPRPRREREARLLHRAIQDKPESDSSAVSRIIGSQQTKPEVKPIVEADDADAVDAPDTVEEVTVAEEALVEDEAPAEEEAVVVEKEPVAVVSSAQASPKTAIAEPEVADSSPGESESEELSVEESSAEDKAEPPVDLFGEPVAAGGPRIRTKKSDTVLIASILIGIGNKPYLRGSAGGLNWESGVAMDFEEIGKWQWTAPANLDTAIEVQVYRNDEDPDRKGRYTLEPGQKLEVSPVF